MPSVISVSDCKRLVCVVRWSVQRHQCCLQRLQKSSSQNWRYAHGYMLKTIRDAHFRFCVVVFLHCRHSASKLPNVPHLGTICTLLKASDKWVSVIQAQSLILNLAM